MTSLATSQASTLTSQELWQEGMLAELWVGESLAIPTTGLWPTPGAQPGE
jgi:hypothetical protein